MPAAKTATVSEEAMISAALTGEADIVTEEIKLSEEEAQAFADAGISADAKVTHSTAKRVRMYRPNGPFGWTPTIISANALRQCIAAGWKAACQDCGRRDCGVAANGRLDTDPNNCPGKDSVKRARCPVCRKKVVDFSAVINQETGEDIADPNEVALPGFETQTAEMRIQARLIEHMLAFHPSESRSYPVAMQAMQQQAASKVGVV